MSALFQSVVAVNKEISEIGPILSLIEKCVTRLEYKAEPSLELSTRELTIRFAFLTELYHNIQPEMRLSRQWYFSGPGDNDDFDSIATTMQ